MDTPSLLDLTRSLATDDEVKASFRADPEAFLRERGHGDLEPADLAVALRHVADALPPALALPVTGVAEAGAGLVDQLLGLVGIDPADADTAWADLTESPDDDLGSDPTLEQDDGLGGLDPFDELGDDPPDLDEPGDRTGGDDGGDAPSGVGRGLDPSGHGGQAESEDAGEFGRGDLADRADDAGDDPWVEGSGLGDHAADDGTGGLAFAEPDDTAFASDDEPQKHLAHDDVDDLDDVEGDGFDER